MRPEVEAALEVLAAGTQFTALRRALFATVASRYLNIGAVGSEVPVDEGDGRLPLEVLLARLPTSTLASVATINKGRTGIKDAKPGRYPLVVTAEQRGTSDHFDFEGPGVMIPMVSSTGHGDASLKRLHFQDGQYAVGSILSVVQPRDPEQLSARYLHAYLSSFKDELLVSRMVGTANVSLTVAKIGEVPVPLLPIDAQRKVDELMALCDRLEARQQDAEAARARLVQSLLDSLTQARDADEFQVCWRRAAGQFTDLITSDAAVEALKATIVTLAVEGRLVPPVPEDEDGALLLRRLAAAKLSVAKDARKQKEIAVDDLPAPPFDAPVGWAWTHLDQVLVISGGVTLGRKVSGRLTSTVPYLRVANVQRGRLDMTEVKKIEVPTDEIEKYRLEAGDLLITEGGDWDKVGRTAVWADELPLCLHQNHVFRARRCSDELDLGWVELYLNSPVARDYFAGASKQTTNLASINMTQLRSCAFPVPPLAEQRRIVAKVTELLALCDQLKARIVAARAKHAQLAQALVEQAVA